MAVREGKVQDLKVHLRGDYMTQGELAPRGYLRAIKNQKINNPSKKNSAVSYTHLTLPTICSV